MSELVFQCSGQSNESIAMSLPSHSGLYCKGRHCTRLLCILWHFEIFQAHTGWREKIQHNGEAGTKNRLQLQSPERLGKSAMILWCVRAHVSTPTRYLYSLSVLYSHSLMKVAVLSPIHLNYSNTWASAYQRIMSTTNTLSMRCVIRTAEQEANLML